MSSLLDIQEPLAETAQALRVRKEVFVDGAWCERVFYGVVPQDHVQCQTWLREQFGEPRYQGDWWSVSRRIFMRQSVYTWYCLAHGKT